MGGGESTADRQDGDQQDSGNNDPSSHCVPPASVQQELEDGPTVPDMPAVGQGAPSVDSGADGLGVRTSGGGLTPPTLSSVEPKGMPARPTDVDPIPVGDEADDAGVPDEPLAVVAHVPDAVPPRPPPSKSVVEPDVPGFAMPVEPPSAPAPEHAVAPPIAGTAGDAPDVIGLTPGDASSVAPSGIPVGATGAAGPIPSGDVMPSGDGELASPPICAVAEPVPNNAEAIASINRRVMTGLSSSRLACSSKH
jgi:hypothetical protein